MNDGEMAGTVSVLSSDRPAEDQVRDTFQIV
jgi:hypothetical protein